MRIPHAAHRGPRGAGRLGPASPLTRTFRAVGRAIADAACAARADVTEAALGVGEAGPRRPALAKEALHATTYRR